MDPEASPRAGLHPSIVLSAYLEPLVRGRRVAILGDATIGLPDELYQRGARLVHVHDPSPARVAEALARVAGAARPHQVAYAVLSGDLGVRDGAFDVVIVPDLSLFADPADTLRRARRLVPASGVAVFVAPNAERAGRRLLRSETEPPSSGAPLGYYELFDLVSLQFAKVRMIGQAPFVGYTVADFAPGGDPEVSVDTSLLAASEEPEHFIAVAGDRPVSLDPYAVIELPWHEVAEAAPSRPATPVEPPRPPALIEAEARLAELGTELAGLREREAKLAGAAARVAVLEGEVERRDGRLKDLEARAGDNHVRAERFANQIRDLEEELVRQRDRGTKLSKLLDDEKRSRTKAEVELGMVRGNPELASARGRAEALGAELDAARARIADLEQEQAETRRRPAADQKLVHRVAELEQAVNGALRTAAEAAAARDAAIARAEAITSQAASIQAEIDALRDDRTDLSARTRAAEDRTVESARRLSDAERRAGEAAQRADDLAKRLAVAERRLADAGPAVAERDALVIAGRALAAERDALAAERDTYRSDAQAREDLAAEAASADLAALEAALRERGHVIAALERDLREGERVGRELLAELSTLAPWGGEGSGSGGGDRAAAPKPPVTMGETPKPPAQPVTMGETPKPPAQPVTMGETPKPPAQPVTMGETPKPPAQPVTMGETPKPPAQPADELRARLDALALGAARSEADLQAAGWRIAQLERELGEARRAQTSSPSVVQIELEQALSAARDEVASLRRALAGAAS